MEELELSHMRRKWPSTDNHLTVWISTTSIRVIILSKSKTSFRLGTSL